MLKWKNLVTRIMLFLLTMTHVPFEPILGWRSTKLYCFMIRQLLCYGSDGSNIFIIWEKSFHFNSCVQNNWNFFMCTLITTENPLLFAQSSVYKFENTKYVKLYKYISYLHNLGQFSLFQFIELSESIARLLGGQSKLLYV